MKSLFAILFSIVSVSACAESVWINENAEIISRPRDIGATAYATDAQLAEHGIRQVSAPDGLEQRFWDWDGSNFVSLPQSEIDSILQAEADAKAEADAALAEAEAQAALDHLATFPATEASVFRMTLVRNFGEGAETNRAIDASAVGNYFTAKQVAGTITVQELADAIILDRLFTELSAWNGTGETWTLPWSLLP